MIVNKKKGTCTIVEFAVLAEHRVKLKGGGKKDQYLDLARGLKKKTEEQEIDGDTNCNWSSWRSQKSIGTGTGGLRNRKTSGDHSNYSIIKIAQNTEDSPGDLRKLTLSQTPVKKTIG